MTQSPFASSDLADVDDVARLDVHSCARHARLCVRVFAIDVHIYISRAHNFSFADIVNQIELARFVQESRIGLYVRKDVSLATVRVT